MRGVRGEAVDDMDTGNGQTSVQQREVHILRMAITPRPYQVEAIRAGVNHFRHGKGNGVIVAPTGAGKSIYAAGIAHELGESLLVFQPSKEILEQNKAKMEAYGYAPSVFSASAGEKQVGEITLATIGSVINKPDLFRRFRHVLIDECHLAQSRHNAGADGQTMYKRFYEAMGRPRMVGLSATPWKLMSNSFGSENRFLTRMKDSMWDEVIHVKQIGDLKREGFMAEMEYFFHRGIDPARLVLNSNGSEYTDASVRAAMMGADWEAKVINMIERLLRHGRKSILVFTPFVRDSEAVKRLLPPGIAEVVHGELPKQERERIIGAFKDGSIPVVLNVAVLSIGFDHPALDTIIDASPTLSLAKYYQRIGRGLRPHASKKSTYVLDMCGNTKTFGKVEDLVVKRDWKGKWVVMSGAKQLTNVILRKPEWR